MAPPRSMSMHGLLGVEAVFGLLEDHGLRSVQHCVGDFGVAVGGEAVHEDGLLLGVVT